MKINSLYLVELGTPIYALKFSILFKIQLSVPSPFARLTPRITGGYQNC